MGRPPLPIGTWGTVRIEDGQDGRGFRARARFRDFDGVTRQVERYGKTKGAARNALTTYLTERTAPASDDITRATTLADVMAIWYAENEDRFSINTRTRYRQILDDHLLAGLGGLRVREASVTRLDAFLKATATHTGAPTAKLCRSVLSGVLGLAVRHGAAPTNPVREVGGITVTRHEPRSLTLEEVAAIRRTVMAWQNGYGLDLSKGGTERAKDLIDIVDVLLGTGARIGEVLAIRWEDVNLDAPSVTITGTIVRDKGSGLVRQAFPKSGSSRRELQLPAFVAGTLLHRRVSVTVENYHDVVFPSKSGTLRDPNNVRSQWRKVRELAGLGWVTPHTFRKTVATLIDAEASLQAAASQMGHSGTEVTARHYVQRTHIGPDMRAVLEALAPVAELGA